MNYNYQEEAAQLKVAFEQVKTCTENLNKRIELLDDQRRECEAEIQDYLHLAELTDFNAAEGYKIAKKIQDTQRRRREIKDLLEMYRALSSSIDFKEVTSNANKAITAIDRKDNHVKQRYYSPKIKKELVVTINRKCIKNVPAHLIKKHNLAN